MALYNWSLDNNLSLNVTKKEEIIVGYQKQPVGEHQPIHINSVEVERVSNRKSSPTTVLPEEAEEIGHECQHHLQVLQEYDRELAGRLHYSLVWELLSQQPEITTEW